MKKSFITILGVALCLGVHGQKTQQDIKLQVSKLLKEAADKGLFSGTVIVAKNGAAFYQYSYGYADWNKRKKITSSSLFNVASLNKKFTEELIRQLEKENKLKLSDPLSNHLDLFPAEIGGKITIQHLIDMRSGLGDYLTLPAYNAADKKSITLRQILEIIKQQPLIFEPGTSRKYSNSGYAVLGGIVENITGKSFQRNLEERIFKPLGLKNTYYVVPSKFSNQKALATTIRFDGSKHSKADCMPATPAGGMYTTPVDLLRFAEAARQGKLASGKAYTEHPVLAGGDDLGWNAAIGFFRDNITVVITSNFPEIGDQLAMRIGDIVAGNTYPPLEVPFLVSFYKDLTAKGINHIRDNIRLYQEGMGVKHDARFLNFIGYQFLKGSRADLAIQVFELNTQLFPDNANTWDSLAEAYLVKGDKERAIKWYSKALELNPQSKNARQKIEELSKQ